MKYLVHLLFIVILFFTSCSQQNEALLLSLSQIQDLGEEYPRQAIKKLDSIKSCFDKESSYMKNKLALLDIRLRDKAYIMHTKDDSIKAICSFFDKHGTAIERQEAYYYMGSVYRDINDYPNAVTSFLKSISISKKNENFDVAILNCAYSQLSFIYKQQLNYQEALNIILDGVAVAEKNGLEDERLYMSVCHRYSDLNDTLLSIKYANIVLQMIEKRGISKNNADILSSAMGIFSAYGYKNNADICYKMLKQLPETSMPFNYLTNLTYYLTNFVSIDSAALARLELYNTTDMVESKYDATRWLTHYYAHKKEYKEATMWAINFMNANNELIEKRQFEHTTNAKNFFQYQRDKEEELSIMQKAAQDRQNLTITIAVSVIILLSGVIFYFYRKKRLLDIIISKEQSIKKVRSIIEEKEKELACGKKELEHMEKELGLLTTSNSRLAGQLHCAEEDFKMLVAQNRELTKLTLMNNISENAKDIVDKIKKTSQGKYHLNDEEWKELLGAVDKLYPEFTYEVQLKFKKISEPMLRVCYLLKIGLSGPEIVNLTDYPRQTVWDRIKRIEKIMNS